MAEKKKMLKRTLTLSEEDWEALEGLGARDGCGGAKDYIYKLVRLEIEHREGR